MINDKEEIIQKLFKRCMYHGKRANIFQRQIYGYPDYKYDMIQHNPTAVIFEVN